MKKIILVVLVALIGSYYVSAQEVEYLFAGEIETDGYQKVIKGAMWSKRPEARIVYEGGLPAGVDTFRLESDYFVRFAEGEHNPFDINYIVFPKGEMVYVKDKIFYSAKCGNKIRYIRPVNMVKIVEKRIEVPKIIEVQTQQFKNKPSLEAVEELKPEKVFDSKDFFPKEFQDITWFKKNKKWFIPLLSSAVIVGTGFIAHDQNHKWYLWFPKNGITPIIIPPVVVDPVKKLPFNPVDANPQG